MIGKKNLSVETLRGIAILLVVAGHVIGSTPEGGMRIPFPSAWRYFYLWIDYLQMPLFTAISGWVYALKSPGSTPAGRLIRNKAMRLLTPMATVSTLYFLIQYVVPGTNEKPVLDEIWKIYLFPYTLFWYLKSLFLIFLVVIPLDDIGAMASPGRWALSLAAAILFYVLEFTVIPHEVPNLFSFKGALNQCPYFIAGVGICRFAPALYHRFRSLFRVAALLGVVFLQLRWFFPEEFPIIYLALLPLWLVPTLFVLFRTIRPLSFFVFFGGYAYSIYLFHGFCTSAGRIILSGLGIYQDIFVFAFAFTLAVFLPVVADRLLSKSPLLRMLLLGKPYK